MLIFIYFNTFFFPTDSYFLIFFIYVSPSVHSSLFLFLQLLFFISTYLPPLLKFLWHLSFILHQRLFLLFVHSFLLSFIFYSSSTTSSSQSLKSSITVCLFVHFVMAFQLLHFITLPLYSLPFPSLSFSIPSRSFLYLLFLRLSILLSTVPCPYLPPPLLPLSCSLSAYFPSHSLSSLPSRLSH